MAINPTFHTALMGYQKAEVLDCLNRMASEIDTYASRQEAADKTIASMKAEIQNLTQRMENLTEENYNLESANAQLRKESFDFDAAKVARDVHEKVLAENQALKEKLEAREDRCPGSGACPGERPAEGAAGGHPEAVRGYRLPAPGV